MLFKCYTQFQLFCVPVFFFLEGGSNGAPLNVWKLSQFDVQDCLIWCRVISTAFLYNFFYCTVVNSMQHHTATSNATCITNCVVSIAVIFSGCHAMLPLCCVTSHGCKGDYKLWKGNIILFSSHSGCLTVVVFVFLDG